MRIVALMPARKTSPWTVSGSINKRTGMRCTIFTQFPVAFCAGRIENSEPAAGLIELTCAFQTWPG